MTEKLELLLHIFLTLAKLCKPGGASAVIADNIALKQQIITIRRPRNRMPKLTTFDRFLFGFVSYLIGKKRIDRIAAILKPARILKFHKALVNRFAVVRILRKNKDKLPRGDRPSWLSFIGPMKDSLWSVKIPCWWSI